MTKFEKTIFNFLVPEKTDIQISGVSLNFIPIKTRVPLKFGSETLNSVTCARVQVEVNKKDGTKSFGWGETPLSVQWVWPSSLSYQERLDSLLAFCEILCADFHSFRDFGHALELGHTFVFERMPIKLSEFNSVFRDSKEPMPWLAALVCASAFDLSLHDAYGMANEIPTYQTYNSSFLNSDLSNFIEPIDKNNFSFENKTPADFLVHDLPNEIPVWHLVGGLDPLTQSELSGNEPKDGYPVDLGGWIERDGLKCLKIKLRGNDSKWDYNRLVNVGKIGCELGIEFLSADFNCTVTDPEYVNEILDQLKINYQTIWDKVLYVEQPFPYDLEKTRIDVRSVVERKPLFMDESAHDWKHVRMGLNLGWNGVALKTCKTQTGALLSLCWARAHGMQIMVQDLTNPMLAQISHVLLGFHAGTIMGVESNGMQFYPDASKNEAKVHPGVYQRREGVLDLSTIRGPGFGYRKNLID